jgi:hypothetical protein
MEFPMVSEKIRSFTFDLLWKAFLLKWRNVDRVMFSTAPWGRVHPRKVPANSGIWPGGCVRRYGLDGESEQISGFQSPAPLARIT